MQIFNPVTIGGAFLAERTHYLRQHHLIGRSALNNTNSRTSKNPSMQTTVLGMDIFILFGLLIIFNIPLMKGHFSSSLIYLPGAFMSGQWWRIFTHIFVHLSWYHLFLDGCAFFLLYMGLEEKRISRKVLYMTTCGLSSLIIATISSDLIDSIGICGLSGVAHGLMAISSMEMMTCKENFRMGVTCFTAVVSKSIYEAVAGDVLFSFMHLGLCGSPVAVSHAGGVLGGIVTFLILTSVSKYQTFLRNLLSKKRSPFKGSSAGRIAESEL